jgi:adenylate cyclase
MGREIERKFLVARAGWRSKVKTSARLVQGYLPTTAGRTVRVRIAGKKAFLTIKGPSKGAARDEYEYRIPLKDAEQLLSRHCAAGLVEKVRHIVPYAGRRWEVDEFRGAHQGLVLAELELSSARQTFRPPPWLGKEVTGDRRYDNSALAKRGARRR